MGKPTTYQRWMIVLSVIGLIIAGSSVFIGIKLYQLAETDDPIIIPIHTPTPTNGGTPTIPYEKPEMLLESAMIVPGVNDAEFQISVSNSEHVMFIAVHFYVDGTEDSYALELNNPISGVFQETIIRTSFSTYTPSSTITIYLIMAYFDKQGAIATERVDDIITFSFLLEPAPLPYYPPEIIVGTFEYSVEETIITFGFSTTYHELINSIGCYFVIDGDVFETATGHDYVIEMIHIESGYYQSFFDYTLFPLDIDVFLYLTVGYVDVEGEDDSYVVEELTHFNIESGTANGIGINYLFIVIAATVALALFTIIKKTRKRRSD